MGRSCLDDGRWTHRTGDIYQRIFCQKFKLIGPGSWAQFADFELSYVSVFIKEEFPMGGLKMRKSLITDLIIPTLLSAPTESICLAGK